LWIEGRVACFFFFFLQQQQHRQHWLHLVDEKLDFGGCLWGEFGVVILCCAGFIHSFFLSAICLCERWKSRKVHPVAVTRVSVEMMRGGQLFWMRMPYLEMRNCELLWEVGWDFRL
jgi:hypothetical protein